MIRSALTKGLTSFHRSGKVSSGPGLSSRPPALSLSYICSFVYVCYDTGQRSQDTRTLVLALSDSTPMNPKTFCCLQLSSSLTGTLYVRRNRGRCPPKTIQSLASQTPKHACHHSTVADEPLFISSVCSSLTIYFTSV